MPQLDFSMFFLQFCVITSLSVILICMFIINTFNIIFSILTSSKYIRLFLKTLIKKFNFYFILNFKFLIFNLNYINNIFFILFKYNRIQIKKNFLFKYYLNK